MKRFGEGVWDLPSFRRTGCGNEFILWAVGVLSGCKLKGGRRNGCKDFLFTGGSAGGRSGIMADDAVSPRRWLFFSVDGVLGLSGRRWAASRGTAPSLLSRLPDKLSERGVLTPAKKGIVVSSRSLGDS